MPDSHSPFTPSLIQIIHDPAAELRMRPAHDAPSYQQQTQAVAQTVDSLSGPPHLCPESVLPSASRYASGTAACQLSTHAGSAGPQQHAADAGAACCLLPELQQQPGQHRLLEVQVLSTCQAHQQQQHAGPGVSAASGGTPIKVPRQQQLHSLTAGSSSSTPQRYQPNSWMHPGLQQYLHELEQSQWTASAAAAAAAAAPTAAHGSAQQGEALKWAQAAAAGDAAGLEQHAQQCLPPAAEAVLAWLARVHDTAAAAAAAAAVDAPGSSSSRSPAQAVGASSATNEQHTQQMVDSTQQHPQQQQEQQQVWPAGPGMAVHPNLLPVLHIAPAVCKDTDGSGNNSSSGGSHHLTSSSSSSSGSGSVCLVADYIPTDAVALLRHSPAVLGGDWHLRFLLHQLLHALADLHSRGLAMGGFSLDQLRMVCPGWVQLLAKPSGHLLPAAAAATNTLQQQQPALASDRQQQQQQQRGQQQQQQQQQWVQGPMLVSEPCCTLPQLTEMWRCRAISNFEYLMWVNAAAGRRWGDRKRHPFLPWVLDFSCRPELDAQGRLVAAAGTATSTSSNSSSSSPPPGWRDLGLSQYRRIKGDAQLDQTYAMSAAAAAAAGAGPSGPWSGCVAGAPGSAAAALGLNPWAWEAWDGSSSNSGVGGGGGGGVSGGVAGGDVEGVGGGPGGVPPPVQPHHISNEPMSELSYAIYMARRLPVELLVQLVRRSFRPEEYPASLEGLYHSSPDEALPQFYCQVTAFTSTHTHMRDLALPHWAQDAADFVCLHRTALESEYVSAHLHKWLDLNFGVALSGSAGLAAKNIHLGNTDSSSSSSSGSSGSDRAAAAARSPGMVVPGMEPCTRGVYQLWHQPHPPRSRCQQQGSSSSWQAGLSTDTVAQQQPNVQDTGPGSSSSSGGDGSGSSPGPGLEACWVELVSLEAAAAAGSWTPAAAAAAGSSTSGPLGAPATSQQQQQRQQQGESQQAAGAPSVSSRAVGSSSSSDRPLLLLPAEAAAADVAALGQAALQLYTRQQQEVALGSSAGLHAAQQCWRYCSSCSRADSDTSSSGAGAKPSAGNGTLRRSNSRRSSSRNGGTAASSRRVLAGSRQTGAGLQSGRLQQQVPAAVSLFVQQCGSGSFNAAELLQVASFLPGWLEDARQFMLALLFQPSQAGHSLYDSPQQQQQQQQEEEEGFAVLKLPSSPPSTSAAAAAGGGGCEAPAAAAAAGPAQASRWRLGDAFVNLAHLAQPGGGLDRLAAAPQALQVCLPAILHVLRGRLLHGVDAAAGVQRANAQQQQQQQQVVQLEGSCLVVFRLASVLSRLQLQQHLVPLLVALLGTEAAGDTQEPGAGSVRAGPVSAAVAAAAAAAGASKGGSEVSSAQQQASVAAGVRVAVGRRAVLQPSLWALLLRKLPQQQLLAVLLPPLLSALLEPQVDLFETAAGTAAAAADGFCQQPQWELACSCAAVLAEGLPFPVVAQHILRPLMLALATTTTPAAAPAPAAAAAATSDRPPAGDIGSSSSSTGIQGSSRSSPPPTAAPAQGVLPAAGAVSPAFRAAVGLLSVARVLPQALVEEFIFRPLLQATPVNTAEGSAAFPAANAAAGGGGGGGGVGADSGSAAEMFQGGRGRLAVAVLPVLEGLLPSLLPLLKAELVLPSLPAATGAEPGTAAAVGAAGGSNPAGAAATAAATGAAAGRSGSSSSSAVRSAGTGEAAGSATAASLSRSSSLQQQQSYAAAAGATGTAAVAAAKTAAMTAGAGVSGFKAPTSSGSSSSSKGAVPAGVTWWGLAELLLAGPEQQSLAACPLAYPRLAALLLVGLECFVLQAAAGSPGADSSSNNSTAGEAVAAAKASTAALTTPTAAAAAAGGSGNTAATEQLVALMSGWLVPSVLQPLLSPQGAAAWGLLLSKQQNEPQQQQQQQQQRRAYWRTVLLLYAAAVHHLGLAAVRAAVPDWHSVEVWLLAETGWEPDQATAAAAGAGREPAAAASPTLQLMRGLALQGSCSKEALAAANMGRSSRHPPGSSSSSSSWDPAVLQQIGLLAALPPAPSAAAAEAGLECLLSTGSGGCSSSTSTRASGSITAGRQGGVQELLGGGNSSSSQLSGRVTHLLQRIAEEKVVRRSLNTTNEFLEGVGWSLPRPTTPTAAAAGSGTAAALGAQGSSSGNPLPAFAQQGLGGTSFAAGGAGVGSAAARSSADGVGRSRPNSAHVAGSSSSSSVDALTDADAMHRAASATASAHRQAARRATAPPTAAVAAAAAAAASSLTEADAAAAAASLNRALHSGQGRSPASAPAATAAAAVAAPAGAAAAEAASSGTSRSVDGPLREAAAGAAGGAAGDSVTSQSWAAELSQLRSLLETPTRTPAGERGPSAGKEWFWLRNNPKLDPSHMLPDFSQLPTASTASSSSGSPYCYGTWQSGAAAAAGSAAVRPWQVPGGMWWEEGWRLGAVCLHSWPAHKERLRALAVDPCERLLVTAGRGGARDLTSGSSSSGSWVVRVWELADAEAKVQYTGHAAAVHQVAFMGPCSPAVASLDVSGAIHVWSRGTGTQLQAFVPVDLTETGASILQARPAAPLPPRPVQMQMPPYGGASDGRSGATTAAATATATAGLGAAPGSSSVAVGVAGAMPGGVQGRQTREQYPAAVTGTGGAAVDSGRRSSYSAGSALESSTAAAGADLGAAEAAAVGGVTAVLGASGGFWERGCSSGRGWQALAALPTTEQLAGSAAAAATAGGGVGSVGSLSPGSAGAAAAAGVLDAAGAAALGGPGWPVAGGHLGYTCLMPVDSNHQLVESTLLAGSDGSSAGGSNGSSTGLLLAGTADGHVCLLDVESGALLEDAVACWDPRPRLLFNSSSAYSRPPQQQVQYQYQQQALQANPLLAAAAGPGVLGPAGWDGLTAAGDPSSCVLSAVCLSGRGGCGSGAAGLGGWVGAGSGGGRITLLDMRAGVVVGNWQAHGQRVSQLQGLGGAQGEHLLLSCSADRTMKLWDLRMLPQAAAGPHASLAFGSSGAAGAGGGVAAAPVVTYRSGRDGIEGFVVYQDAAIVYGGASIGLAPLELPSAAQAGPAAAAAGLPGGLAGQLQHQQQQQQGGSVQSVRMTAVKGLGYRGSGVREGLGAAGGGTVVGLGLLPHSKLLVVGTEDGLLRICR